MFVVVFSYAIAEEQTSDAKVTKSRVTRSTMALQTTILQGEDRRAAAKEILFLC
jgi:hypothetical protein